MNHLRRAGYEFKHSYLTAFVAYKLQGAAQRTSGLEVRAEKKNLKHTSSLVFVISSRSANSHCNQPWSFGA